MATLKDIADIVGISTSAVSRVINCDRTLSISEEKRRKVFEVAEKLEYVPTKDRKKNRKQYTIGLVHCFYEALEIEVPYLLSLRAGIEERCRNNNIRLVKVTVDEEIDSKHPICKADGILVIGWMPKDKLDNICGITPKIVSVGGCLDPYRFDCVDTDLRETTIAAVDYLIERGHKKIGFIGGSPKLYYPEYETMDLREQTFRAYMQLKGLLREDNISIGKFSTESGYKMAQEFLREREMPTAFFVASDMLAIGVISAFRENHIRIPEDVSIISCDDSPVAKFTIPPLTTMKIYAEFMAETAVDLLIERINKDVDVFKKVIIPTKLIVRDSCSSI